MAPGVRVFVAAFLGVFLVASAVGLEAWPLTGWGLYTHRLTDRVAGLEIVTVDTAGAERAIPWDDLPIAFRTTERQVDDLVALPAAEREPICRAWAAGVRSLGYEVIAVRVYRTVARRTTAGVPAVIRRDLRLTCGRRR